MKKTFMVLAVALVSADILFAASAPDSDQVTKKVCAAEVNCVATKLNFLDTSRMVPTPPRDHNYASSLSDDNLTRSSLDLYFTDMCGIETLSPWVQLGDGFFGRVVRCKTERMDVVVGAGGLVVFSQHDKDATVTEREGAAK